MDPAWIATRENGEEFPGDEHPAMIALKTGTQVNDVVMGIYNPIKEKQTWICIDAIPIFKKGKKKPHEVYALFRDITAQKEAEKKLEKNKNLYINLFNSLKFGFAYHEMITDKNGKPVDYRFIEINYAYEELTGLKREEIINKTVKEVLP
ncbi:MAG: chemotaxis protein CheR, partial [Marinilabiliales bacterium]